MHIIYIFIGYYYYTSFRDKKNNFSRQGLEVIETTTTFGAFCISVKIVIIILMLK